MHASLSHRIWITAFAAASLYLPSMINAADWPHFRGPDRNGISTETEWSDQWAGGSPKVLWEGEAGLGFSTFSVANGRVITTGHEDQNDSVVCFDATTGKLLWKHSYPADLGDKYFEGGTTGTPTIEGGRVYHLSRWGDVLCLEADTGKVVWSKNVQKETQIRIPDWGYTGAPFITGELIILNVGRNGVALKKATGEIAWRSEDESAGYSTPYPIEQDGSKLVVLGSGRSYVAVDPLSGSQAWEFEWATRYGVNAADPIFHDGQLFISSGYNKGCALLKLAKGGPEVVWQNKEMKNQMNASVLIDGALYGIDDDQGKRASLRCVDFKTGELKWEEKSIGFGSLIGAAGKLIVLTAKGELVIARANPAQFDEISRAQVLSGKCWTAPVLANGLLYCRNSEGHVVCLDLRKN